MANSKISALSAVTSVGATDELVLASGGATKKITGANLTFGNYGFSDIAWTVDPAHLHATATVPDGANRTVYVRVRKGLKAVGNIVLFIGASSGNIAVAVYDNTGSGTSARPNNRLATSGSVASPGTGLRAISLGTTVDVAAGYWMAVAADNTTVSFYRALGTGGTNLFPFSSGKEAAFPPPATATLVADDRPIIMLGTA